jgi:hypothetical protein
LHLITDIDFSAKTSKLPHYPPKTLFFDKKWHGNVAEMLRTGQNAHLIFRIFGKTLTLSLHN